MFEKGISEFCPKTAIEDKDKKIKEVVERIMSNHELIRVINRKTFLLFIIFIVVEIVIIYALLSYWIKVNIQLDRLKLTPWSVSVEVVK